MNKKLKDITILQFIDSLSIGGAERMAVNISNALASEGIKVVLCVSRDSGPLETFVVPGVLIVYLKKKNSFDVLAFFRLLRTLKKYKIDVIHAHSSSIFWGVGAKILLSKIKIIWHDHSGDEGKLSKDRKKAVQRISGFINGIISVNENLKSWAEAYMKVPKNRIAYIGNFPMLPLVTEKEREKEDVIKIVCLANLRPQKDHFTLIEAIAFLKAQLPHISFKVIFAGSYTEDDYSNGIKDLIERKNLKNIIEIRGAVTDTSKLLCDSDIGVLSSVTEGLPVSLLEYGLAGLAVAVTNVGQCAEVVNHGMAGMVVPTKDAESLAAALKLLITDKEKRSILASELKKRVETKYGSGKFLRGYFGLLSNVI